MIWIIFIGIALLSYAVQANLQSKFKRFSREPLASGLTGREVAEKMLHDNGIYNVTVISTSDIVAAQTPHQPDGEPQRRRFQFHIRGRRRCCGP